MSDQMPPSEPTPSSPYEPYQPYQAPTSGAAGSPVGMPFQPPPVRRSSGIKRLTIGSMMLAIGVATLLWSIPAIAHGFGADAMVPADGKDHTMELPADSTRGLYLQNTFGTSLNCSMKDGDGKDIRIRRPGATYQVNSWTAQAEFNTGDGTVVINCAAQDNGFDELYEVRIGPTSGLAIGIVAIFVTIGAGFFVIGGLLAVTFGFRRRRALAARPE